MEDNEILARWQGWTDIWQGNTALVGTAPHNAVQEEVPYYLNDAAAWDSLLDTLVEKGFEPTLQYHKEMGWWADITKEIGYWADTRREAIIAACLEVARKELGECQT